MRGEEGVDATRSTDQVDIRIEDGCAEGSGQNAGHVNGTDACRPVNHFQRQTDQQLDQQVEQQVEPSSDAKEKLVKYHPNGIEW